MQRGFSLLELSIVLVIIGLITGGIMAGQSMVRAAELRSVMADFSKYRTALNVFREKYNAIPGDMKNATSYWGAELAANCPGDQTTPSTTTATCNGNGNGLVIWSGAAGYGGESHRFWQHLANAGLIEGQYTGTHGAGTCNTTGECNVTLGVNAPASKISGAGWSISYLGAVAAGHAYYFEGSYPHVLFFGSVSNWTSGWVLKPDEAYSIDTKLDDGKPGTGIVLPWNFTYSPTCTTSNNTSTSEYNLTTTGKSCALVFKLEL